jgi:hypothetical protein
MKELVAWAAHQEKGMHFGGLSKYLSAIAGCAIFGFLAITANSKCTPQLLAKKPTRVSTSNFLMEKLQEEAESV